VRIRTSPQVEEQVYVFLGEFAENHRGPERPVDVFNGSGDFVVVEDEGGGISFLRRGSVWIVALASEDGFVEELADSDPMAGDFDTEVRLGITLEDGSLLEGSVRYQLPQAQRRVNDFLNEETPFFTLYQEDEVLLVNRSRVARVVEYSKKEAE
jgi:hypothetical protein